MRILKERNPCSQPSFTRSSISSGVFDQPSPLLQYIGMAVRAAPPISSCTGLPAALPVMSHSAMSMVPAMNGGTRVMRSPALKVQRLPMTFHEPGILAQQGRLDGLVDVSLHDFGVAAIGLSKPHYALIRVNADQ